MVSWKAVYARQRDGERFRRFFERKGRIPKETDFDLRAYVLPFESVTPAETDGVPGPLNGPLTQEFALGAVVIGVTSGAFLPQQAQGDAAYPPSRNQGRRDLFTLYIEYTNDEQVTMPQLVLTASSFGSAQARIAAEALDGSGFENEFPTDGILVAPANSLSVACASMLAVPYGSSLANMRVDTVFHAMVPREEWMKQ